MVNAAGGNRAERENKECVGRSASGGGDPCGQEKTKKSRAWPNARSRGDKPFRRRGSERSAASAKRSRVVAYSLDGRECNAEQQAFCRKVAERVLTEMDEDSHQQATQEVSEPLRWALHGGPGTGKSYTLNLVRKELFEEILGWQHKGSTSKL